MGSVHNLNFSEKALARDRVQYIVVAGRRSSITQAAARWRITMAWTTPTLVEICIGLEINGYLPAEF
jgi:coenzyme PQQ precursor peptide PqqA